MYKYYNYSLKNKWSSFDLSFIKVCHFYLKKKDKKEIFFLKVAKIRSDMFSQTNPLFWRSENKYCSIYRNRNIFKSKHFYL